MENISIQKIKWIKSLQLKKNREHEGLFVVEGPKIVEELLEYLPDSIQIIVGTSEVISSLSSKDSNKLFIAKRDEMDRLSNHNSPSSILSIVKKIEMSPLDFSKKILLIDGIQDPGNLGTIIRTADWFGINQIVCSENTVDLYNNKTVQATMGSFLRVNIHYRNLVDLINEIDFPIHGALMNGTNIKEIEPDSIHILILGNEGNGISQEVIDRITNPITIKGFGGSESLNVGVAAGILMQHWCK